MMIAFLIYLYTVLEGLVDLAYFIILGLIITGMFITMHTSLENGSWQNCRRYLKRVAIGVGVSCLFIVLVPTKTEVAVIVGAQMAFNSEAVQQLNEATGIGAEYIKELLAAELDVLKQERLTKKGVTDVGMD